jgi:hypothetical protein
MVQQRHYLGLRAGYQTNAHPAEADTNRTFRGVGLNYYYEGLFYPKFLSKAPGITAGFGDILN